MIFLGTTDAKKSSLSMIEIFPNNTEAGETGTSPLFRRVRRIAAIWLLLAIPFAAATYASGFAPRGVMEFGDATMSLLIGDDEGADSSLSLVRGDAVSSAVVQESRILIPSVGIDAPIQNVTSTDPDVLNTALLSGVVHYPGSAFPGQDGNVFLFGHSTGLAVVHNQAFRSFNRLGEVEPGDTIRIRSGSREYWYRARSRTLVHADAATIDLRTTPGMRLLTLSTCNVFGKKDDRFVIEAEFVKSYTLRSFMID